jgi:drug/metabolite transporter (DMT)-like permease
MVAAILAFGIVGLYLWSLHRNTASYPLSPFGCVLILLSALFAAYGANWRVRYRRTALGIAAAALIMVGLDISLSSVFYLGLPLAASGVLALASILRGRRHPVPASP